MLILEIAPPSKALTNNYFSFPWGISSPENVRGVSSLYIECVLYLADSVRLIKQHLSNHQFNLRMFSLIPRLRRLEQLSSEADHSDGDRVLMLGQPDLHQGEESQGLVTGGWNNPEKLLP